MTNDDLTPEEREALSSLPRERMPSAGLEGRVVAAMREHGHIARTPARVIRLTTSRVAGLLAACLVLMIGAYSIGLNRGLSHETLKKVEPKETSILSAEPARDAQLGVKPPASNQPVVSIPEAVDQGAIKEKKSAPPLDWKLNVPQVATRNDAKQEARQQNEAPESIQDAFTQGLAKGKIPGATDLQAPMSPMPSQLRAKSASSEASGGASSLSTSRTFALNGGALIVDAPDSLRIVTDEHGRTLLIYTSDGVIRIRLAD